MIARLILKGIGVLTLLGIAIVSLAVIFIVGWFFLVIAFPNRMSVIGRVTDSAGRPIKAVQVRAVPLPVYTPHLDHSMEPKDKPRTAVTDENGRFRFKRLIASGGVKEGMWVQEYDIRIDAEGYEPKKIHVWNDLKNHKDVITLEDVVLEQEKPVSANRQRSFSYWKPTTRNWFLATANRKLETIF